MNGWFCDFDSGPDVVSESDTETKCSSKGKVVVRTQHDLNSSYGLNLPVRTFSSSSSDESEILGVKAEIVKRNDSPMQPYTKSLVNKRRGQQKRTRSRSRSRTRTRNRRRKSAEESHRPTRRRKLDHEHLSLRPKYVLRRVRLLCWKQKINITDNLTGPNILKIRITKTEQFDRLERIMKAVLNGMTGAIEKISIQNHGKSDVRLGQYCKIRIQLESLQDREHIERCFEASNLGLTVQKMMAREMAPRARPRPKSKMRPKERIVLDSPSKEGCKKCGMTWRGVRRICPRCGSNKVVEAKHLKKRMEKAEPTDDDSDTIMSSDGISYF